MTKTKIFLDADDTILESSKTVIATLNARYNITPPKTFADLRCWDYSCIYPDLGLDEIRMIFDSDDFFERVTPVAEFEIAYERLRDDFDFCVITTGTCINLDKKEQWFKHRFPGLAFIGIETEGLPSTFDKSIIPMDGGIQIDDRADALVSTTASCKILIQNHISVPWNVPPPGANLYVVQNWQEIGQILDFTVKCPLWYMWGGEML